MKTEIIFVVFFISFLSYQSKKTLVLLDDWLNVETNSLFWKQITDMGYDIDFKMANDKDIKLTNFGEYLYDNIIFFAPTFSDSKKNEINIQNLLKFIDDGHDLMIFGSSDSSKFMRELVNEFGVDYDDYDSELKDSLYLHQDSGIKGLNKQLLNLYDEEIIISKNIIGISSIFNKPNGYILYKGIGMDLDPQNKYIFPILSGDKNSYSVSKSTGEVYSNGEHIKLVNGYQARNNRRIVLLGSTDICSDKFYYLSMTEENKGILPYLEVKYLRRQASAKLINKGLYLNKNSYAILVDGENSGEVFDIKENGYMGSTFMQLVIPSCINTNYIKYFIDDNKTLLKNNKKGSAIPHLNKEIFKKL